MLNKGRMQFTNRKGDKIGSEHDLSSKPKIEKSVTKNKPKVSLFPKGPEAVQIPGLKLVKILKIWSIRASFGPVGGNSVYTLRYVIVEYVP